MNMKAFFAILITAFVAAGMTSCEYDDSGLWNEIRDHDNRIAHLESLCDRMNTNISSLQTIVSAMQENDYVTSIIPVSSGGQTIGYTICFSKSGNITIYHGKDGINGTDGQDGHTPVIGVRQDPDGIYYWTLDGEWLLDEEGNRIKANGTDGAEGEAGQPGADGTVPQLKIESGYWFVSYNGGSSWTRLDKATGEDGKDGSDGDSMFSDVTYDDEFVYFVLADNVTSLTVPRKSADFELRFADGGSILGCSPGETISVSYTLAYGDDNTEVAVMPYGGWAAKVEKTDNTSGNIIVTAPDPVKDGEIIVLASDGKGKMTMKKLVCEEGVISIVTKSYVTDCNATTIEVELMTNRIYTVSIPDDAKSWISVADIRTKATVRNDVVSLDIAANIGSSTRTATVSLVNSAGEVLDAVTVSQTGATIADNEIWYLSSDGNIVKPFTSYSFVNSSGDIYTYYTSSIHDKINNPIVSNVYENGKGVLIFENDVTEIEKDAFNWRENLSEITLPGVVKSIGDFALQKCEDLSEIIIPDGVTSIGFCAFNECTGLAEINIPSSVTSIGEYAFEDCVSLKEITIPGSVKTLGSCAFRDCSGLEKITIQEGVTSLDSAVFQDCSSLAEITIPESVTSIGNDAFYGCSSLAEIAIPDRITSIGRCTFYGCSSLSEIIIPENVTSIGFWAFGKCDGVKAMYCRPTVPPLFLSDPGYPPYLGITVSQNVKFYVPTESVEQYKSAYGWSDFASQIVGYDFSE